MRPTGHLAISLAVSAISVAVLRPDTLTAVLMTVLGVVAGTLIDLDHFAVSIVTKRKAALQVLLKNARSYSKIIELYEYGGELHYNALVRLAVHCATIGGALLISALLSPQQILIVIATVLLVHLASDIIADTFTNLPADQKFLIKVPRILSAMVRHRHRNGDPSEPAN